MNDYIQNILEQLKNGNFSPELEEIIKKELFPSEKDQNFVSENRTEGFYDHSDMEVFFHFKKMLQSPELALRTLDELLEKDKKREEDGFPRRIRLGKLVKPLKGKKSQVIIVPTTTESKLYHDDSITEDGEDNTGGSGEGDEGEIIGEENAQTQPGDGEGQGAGQGEGGDHDMSSDAYDLGKVLTQKFELPNLKSKGKKPSLTKYQYDLTDRNRGFGQVLDKKATLKKIIENNILLDNIKKGEDFHPEDFLVSPQDMIYRILSKEKDYESQALVFFMRDYSGSMEGKPTEVITTQHILLYSWLMYQYHNHVVTRFIVHDTDAKEVPDFYSYFKANVAGGTRVAPAFNLVNKIVENENLAKDYNIYIFYGTDGDDWDSDGKELLEEIRKSLIFTNRIGITVAKNNWTSNTETTVEKNINASGILKEKADLIRLDSMSADDANDAKIIEGIKHLIS